MDRDKLRDILEEVRQGALEVEQACHLLADWPYADLGYAKVDLHRPLTQGIAEAIFCPGKTTSEVINIAKALLTGTNGPVLATRAKPSLARAFCAVFPKAKYYPRPRLIILGEFPPPKSTGLILIISGGTTDIPVAEEAFLTAQALGCRAQTLYDIGVAGLHRLLDHRPSLSSAQVIIAVAGMEGALPSVAASLTACPVIAVPSSTGYGVAAGGYAALAAMLSTCVPRIGVVNIDNGFGAACLAAAILKER